MTQRQITNHKNNNLLILVGVTKVLPEIVIKFRHLKYRRNVSHVINAHVIQDMCHKLLVLTAQVS
jgi:hypothetical protein